MGQIHIAGGQRQRFEGFDRLTITAPDANGDLRILNQADGALAMLHQTQSGHTNTEDIGVQEFRDLSVAPGDQISLSPAPPAQDVFIIPEAPFLHFARFEAEYPQPLYAPNQKPPAWLVHLEWTHPDQGSSNLLGFNIYRAVYKGRRRIDIRGMNPAPQVVTWAKVEDVIPPYPFNHRFAVTAVGRDGTESLFSNIRIMDHTTHTDLIDAGFMPL